MNLQAKWYVDRFSRFCTAHRRVSHYFIMGRYVFPPKLPLFLDRSGPHLTHGTYGPHESSTQTASGSLQPFSYGSQILCCTMHCQRERKPPKSILSLRISSPRRVGPSHGHRQHAQKFGSDSACGSGDMLADRQTQTDRQTCSLQYFPRSRV